MWFTTALYMARVKCGTGNDMDGCKQKLCFTEMRMRNRLFSNTVMFTCEMVHECHNLASYGDNDSSTVQVEVVSCVQLCSGDTLQHCQLPQQHLTSILEFIIVV